MNQKANPIPDSAVIRRAAMALKVIRLASEPGADSVMIRLNMEPTYEEIKEALIWHTAFRIALENNDTIFEIAQKIKKEIGR